jgi:hypothetical protein
MDASEKKPYIVIKHRGHIRALGFVGEDDAKRLAREFLTEPPPADGGMLHCFNPDTNELAYSQHVQRD